MKAQDLIEKCEALKEKSNTMTALEILNEMSRIYDDANLVLDELIEKYVKSIEE